MADLAESKVERGYLADIVVDALRKEGVRIGDLATQLDPFAHFYGAASGEQLVRDLSVEASTVEDIIERRDRFFHGMDNSLVDRLPDHEKEKTIQESLLFLLATALEAVVAPIEQAWGNRPTGRGDDTK